MNPYGFVIYCNITLSYGYERSPNSLYDFFAWPINSSGSVSHDHNYVYNSYGKNRRTRIIRMMRIMFSRMVTAITEATMSIVIPTDLFSKKFTPDTNYSYRVYYSNPKGDVGYNVYVSNDSYGIRRTHNVPISYVIYCMMDMRSQIMQYYLPTVSIDKINDIIYYLFSI